jgi:hypothetical protein
VNRSLTSAFHHSRLVLVQVLAPRLHRTLGFLFISDCLPAAVAGILPTSPSLIFKTTLSKAMAAEDVTSDTLPSSRLGTKEQ